jgi:hypothetical protein
MTKDAETSWAVAVRRREGFSGPPKLLPAVPLAKKPDFVLAADCTSAADCARACSRPLGLEVSVGSGLRRSLCCCFADWSRWRSSNDLE